MHLCRGNRGGHWHAEGSYEEVAERLFNAHEYRLLLPRIRQHRAPAISRRSASCRRTNRWCSVWFRPKCPSLRTRLRSGGGSTTPPNSSTWTGSPISPQCGFASVDTGNPVTAEAQARKLELVCDWRARSGARHDKRSRGDRMRKVRARQHASRIFGRVSGRCGLCARRLWPRRRLQTIEAYPNHPVRILAASAAGGNPDVIARASWPAGSAKCSTIRSSSKTCRASAA